MTIFKTKDFDTLQGYEHIVDQKTGTTIAVERATGEVFETITVTLPVGTQWITPEAMELIRERKEKQRAFFEKQDACKPLGSYIFVSTELSNSELKPATLARLVFLSTYVRYETNELYRTQRKLMNIDDLPEVMRMSFSSVHRFMKEVCSLPKNHYGNKLHPTLAQAGADTKSALSQRQNSPSCST